MGGDPLRLRFLYPASSPKVAEPPSIWSTDTIVMEPPRATDRGSDHPIPLGPHGSPISGSDHIPVFINSSSKPWLASTFAGYPHDSGRRQQQEQVHAPSIAAAPEEALLGLQTSSSRQDIRMSRISLPIELPQNHRFHFGDRKRVTNPRAVCATLLPEQELSLGQVQG